MPRKCPPNTICFESYFYYSIILLAICGLVITYMLVTKTQSCQNNTCENNTTTHHNTSWNPFSYFFHSKPNIPYSNIPGDVYMNPYSAPLRDTRYMIPTHDIRGHAHAHHNPLMPLPTHVEHIPASISAGLPINVSTQAIDTHYRQVGVLTRQGPQETILALFGRPLYTNRDKWQFYAISDNNNGVKLPVSTGSKSCMGEYGCNNLSNNDIVHIEGYNDSFKVTLYDNATMKYIPFI